MNPATRSRLEAESEYAMDTGYGKAFIKGAEHLERILCEAAPEFDGDAHLCWLNSERAKDGGYEPSPQANARWMHGTLAAQIAGLKSELELALKAARPAINEECIRLKAELAAAKAELAEQFRRMKQITDDLIDDKNQLRTAYDALLKEKP